jgi:hypothetical protein
MKSEDEILHELQKLRATMSSLAYTGKPINPMLHGAEQALGWALDRLRAPSEAEELIRKQGAHRNMVRMR